MYNYIPTILNKYLFIALLVFCLLPAGYSNAKVKSNLVCHDSFISYLKNTLSSVSDFKELEYDISYNSACPQGWICSNSNIFHVKFTRRDNRTIVGELYIAPYEWIGLYTNMADKDRWKFVSTGFSGNRRFLILTNGKKLEEELVDLFHIRTFYGYSYFLYCKSCDYRQEYGAVCKYMELETSKSIDKKITSLIYRKHISDDSIVEIADSCRYMGYPCLDIYSRIVKRKIKTGPKNRELWLIPYYCNDAIAMNIYDSTEYDDSCRNGGGINISLYDYKSSYFSRCVSKDMLNNMIGDKGDNNKDEIHMAMLIRAIGEKDMTDALPYILWQLRKAKTLVLQKECVRSLGLIGYSGTIRAAIRALRDRQHLFSSNLKVGYAFSKKRRLKAYSIMNMEIYKNKLFMYSDKERDENKNIHDKGQCAHRTIRSYIDVLYDVVLRSRIPGHGKLTYHIESVKDGKGIKHVYLIVDNREEEYLDLEKYYYNVSVVIDDNEYKISDYTIRGEIGPVFIVPYEIWSREITSLMKALKKMDNVVSKEKKVYVKYGKYKSNLIDY